MNPQQRTSVRIWWDLDIKAYKLSSSFNEALQDILKKQIPGSERSWDAQTRLWTFTERQLPSIQSLLKFIDITPHLTTRQQAESARAATDSRRAGGSPLSTRTDIELAMIEFLKLIPYTALKTGFLRAQLLLHPDKGGNGDDSAKLNALWDRLKKEVYHQ